VAGVNIISATISARVQIVFTIAKLVAAGIVIVVGVYNLCTGRMGSLPTDGFDASSAGYGTIALAFYSGLWSYDGIKNNQQNLRISIVLFVYFIGILLIFRLE